MDYEDDERNWSPAWAAGCATIQNGISALFPYKNDVEKQNHDHEEEHDLHLV